VRLIYHNPRFVRFLRINHLSIAIAIQKNSSFPVFLVPLPKFEFLTCGVYPFHFAFSS